MKNHHHQPLQWKAIIVSALVGYILAVFTFQQSPSAGIQSIHQEKIHIDSSRAPLGIPHRILTTVPDEVSNEKDINANEEVEVESEEEEEEEEEPKAIVLDSSISTIVLLLIVLTLIFEYVKESIEESADRNMGPIIQGLFGELTVLGFLSMVTFCVTKMGVFDTLGAHLFGEGEEEELLEIFESVHFMLFFIMVFFVINVLVLMRGSKLQSEKWWLFNRACLDPDYMKKFDIILSKYHSTYVETSYFSYLITKLFPYSYRNSKESIRSELALFRGLRYEFITERSLEPPFSPEYSNAVSSDFDFGAYLTICQSKSIGHMVHLSSWTWIFLAIVTFFFSIVANMIENNMKVFAWVWAASGWLTFLLGTVFDFHMSQLLDKMMARSTEEKPAYGTNGRRSERSSLLHMTAGVSALPKWTDVDLEEYMRNRSALKKYLLKKAPNPTRQDTFYWWEVKGPKVYTTLFQIQMVFTAAYVSLLFLTILPIMVFHSEATNLERLVFLIIAMFPVYLLLSKYQVAAANLTQACSIGNHRKPAAVSAVERDEKTAMIIKELVTLLKLKQVAESGFDLDSPKETTLATKQDLDSAKHIFESLDGDGSGEIAREEIGELFETLGTRLEQETLDAIVKALDTDGSGDITMDEFLRFYERYILVKVDREGLHHLAKDMFAQLDADDSGEITLSELKDIITKLDVGFTLDEIGELVKELDESDEGTVSEEEFAHLLLEKHYRLFQYAPLPALE